MKIISDSVVVFEKQVNMNQNSNSSGCASNVGEGQEEHMTEYVVTRWYRAPELLLSCTEYSTAIDVWSVGCILAELLGRKPLFPGKDYVDQLNIITKVVGSPTSEELDRFVSSEKAKSYVLSLPHQKRMDLHNIYPHANKLAVDLVDKMLVTDPKKRISVVGALQHPYLNSLHDESDEPTCPHPFDFDFDIQKMLRSHTEHLGNTATKENHNVEKVRSDCVKTNVSPSQASEAIKMLIWDEILVNNPEQSKILDDSLRESIHKDGVIH